MKEKLSTIYLIRCLPNGKCYIGQTTKTATARWGRHVREANCGDDGCQLLYRAIRKYGPDAFEVTVLCSGVSANEADFLEESFISRYDSTNPLVGMNIKPGGRTLRGFRFSVESIAKMKESSRRYWSNPENRQKAAARMMGKANASGPRTEEQKARIAAASQAYWSNPESRLRHAQILNAPETVIKRSAAIRESLARPEVKEKRARRKYRSGPNEKMIGNKNGVGKRSEAFREKMKTLWLDPIYRQKVMEGIRLAKEKSQDGGRNG